jgi:ParB-like nuclease domain
MKGTRELDFGELDAASRERGDDRALDIRTKNGGNQTLPGQAADHCRLLRVRKILDPEPDRELDHDLVCSIAESVRTIGFLHPIAVRKVQIEKKSRLRTKIVLVAGAHRLEAARYLGHEFIECKFVHYDDDPSVQLVQIGEDLFRKQLTVLRQSELLTKWYDVVSKNDLSGQDRAHTTRRQESCNQRRACR